MKRLVIYFGWVFIFSTLWFGFHQSLGLVLSHFPDGDNTGYYREVTAFGYLVQIMSSALFAAVISFRLFISLGDLREFEVWYAVLSSRAGSMALGTLLICCALIQIRLKWVGKLFFENDKYGYDTTTAATNAIIASLFAYLLFYGLTHNKEKRRGWWYYAMILMTPLVLSLLIVNVMM